MGDQSSGETERQITLVARKPCFGLPTSCPSCLPVYIYLRFCKIPFTLEFNLIYPDSDQIPFVESGDYVIYNNENGGVIENSKEEGIVDLDSEARNIPEWVSMKAMLESWLADAILYELWVACEKSTVYKIYYSDLPWPIGKILYFKQGYSAKKRLGITSDNAERREEEIYRRALLAYDALSSRLGEQTFLFEDRPTSLDAIFLGHVLFVLHALPETSVLRSKLLGYNNIVTYAENLKIEYVDNQPSSSSSSIPKSDPSSSASRQGRSSWTTSLITSMNQQKLNGSKPKAETKREKTAEEKQFRKRAKYFLVAQFVAVFVFLSIFGGSNDAEADMEDDDDGDLYYE